LCRVADRRKSDVGWIASSIFNGWRPKAPSLRLQQKSWFPEANPSINSHFTNSCSNRSSLSLRVVGSFASRLQARVATIAANGALCLCNGGWHADDYSLVSAMMQRTGRAAKLPFPVHPHAAPFNGIQARQRWTGHATTSRYTALAQDRFKEFWRD
jgi:hypothetical protein